jgi:predicted enzyme related to lactoylglutathione lyase
MDIMRLQNVYTISRSMQESVAYEAALGLPVKFRDGLKWCQFDAGGGSFALSSLDEAPANGRGSIPVFTCSRREVATAQILDAGGRLIDSHDMGPHGSVMTFLDLEGNLFQILVRSSGRHGHS